MLKCLELTKEINSLWHKNGQFVASLTLSSKFSCGHRELFLLKWKNASAFACIVPRRVPYSICVYTKALLAEATQQPARGGYIRWRAIPVHDIGLGISILRAPITDGIGANFLHTIRATGDTET